jgi:hypothetical protein
MICQILCLCVTSRNQRLNAKQGVYVPNPIQILDATTFKFIGITTDILHHTAALLKTITKRCAMAMLQNAAAKFVPPRQITMPFLDGVWKKGGVLDENVGALIDPIRHIDAFKM